MTATWYTLGYERNGVLVPVDELATTNFEHVTRFAERLNAGYDQGYYQHRFLKPDDEPWIILSSTRPEWQRVSV